MESPEETRVLLDVMVGGLTSLLRMVGYDTVYALEEGVEADDGILRLARDGDRTLVTRDRQLAERSRRAVLLESTDTDEQLRELREAGFELTLSEPERCSRCNGTLEPASQEKGPDYGPDPAEEPVWSCVDCGQYFWKGSHWDAVGTRLESLHQ